MAEIPRRQALAAAAMVGLVAAGGLVYAQTSGPTDEEAAEAVKVLDEYVRSRTAPSPTATVTVTPTPTPTSDGGSFATTTTWSWEDGPLLGSTCTGEQQASAQVSGLTGPSQNAGFRFRLDGNGIRVAVSGNQWKIEPSGGTPIVGDFAHGPAGRLAVAVSQAGAVTISWDGTPVTTQSVPGGFGGRGVAATIWQESPTVNMTGIASNVDPTCATQPPVTTGPTTPPSTTRPPVAGARWLSGAASKAAVDGSFARWRGEPVGIVGTWDDSREAAAEIYSLDRDLAAWRGPIDIAVGAIWSGQTWGNAASGAYNPQWTRTLQQLKAKTAGHGIPQDKVFIRFAHEMNGNWTDWNVKPGQEANFRSAISRFSALRYDIMPQAKVVLCPNDGTSSGQADPRSLFVGKDGSGRRVVDVYCVDTYNQYPHRTDYGAISASFSNTSGGIPVGVEAHRQFAQAQGVPFAIGEWSSCGVPSECAGGGGEAPEYVRAMNDWIRRNSGDINDPKPGQVIYEVQFNLWNRFFFYPNAPQPRTAAMYASLSWGQ
jgi:hypothetical protein